MANLLELNRIRCRLGAQAVIQEITLHIHPGELASLLGPSGCGKTTLLRAIAGFIPLESGEIRLDGQVISRPGFTLPPEERQIGLVFQDYALFPHLDVAANIAYGLRKLPRAQQRQRVDELLELVGLGGLHRRHPHELSGGQQQRIALARALAPRPRLLLLDEPFSNLDVDLRERLRREVRDILLSQGQTGILVTHDQQEAFSWGQRAGVLHQGELQQWGDCFDLYHQPSNRFVADFIGEGVILPGTLLAPSLVQTSFCTLDGDCAYPFGPNAPVEILIRPDDVIPDPASPLTGRVLLKEFRGSEILYLLQLPGNTRLMALFPSRIDLPVGAEPHLCISPAHLVLFPRETP
ncbi:MAG: ABC transporter ATP-binding protein [Magnetococcales bacterium]|nr:ABC transporter ATP-binding protein [Magnetococcales bacterium]